MISGCRKWVPCLLGLLGAAMLACGSEPAATSKGDASAVADSEVAPDAADTLADAVADAVSDVSVAPTATVDWFAAAPHAKAVDPLIGTALSVANVGSAIPGATVPWGLVKCSPDTSNKGGMQGAFHCAGYQRSDPYIHAFSHNHLQGTGAPDYGNVAVLPFAELTADITSRNGRRSTYSHDSESASAGYYAVTLDGPKARHELTATAHCGVHRTVFLNENATGGLLIDLTEAIAGGMVTSAQVQLDPATQTVTGKLHNFGDFSSRFGGFPVFFTARFSRPWQAAGTWSEGVLNPGSLSAAQAQPPAGKDRVNLGMYAQFANPSQPVELQVCLSYVDAAGAKQNFAAEVEGKSFDQVRQAAVATWEKQLATIDIDTTDWNERSIYYSALYRALAMPTLWSDVDGRYLGFDKAVHTATGWNYYTDLSLWDTFRTLHPLYALVFPTVDRDVMRSLQAMAEQKGCLPQWAMGAGDTGSMIGQHALSALADAVAKGIIDFDVAKVYAVAKNQLANAATGPGCGQLDAMPAFNAKGWIAMDDYKSSVALTLEYSYNYAALAVLADHLGLPDDATQWQARTQGYQHVWDAETQFFRPRHSDGKWQAPFDTLSWDFGNNFYVEGTAWQWLWFVPHDPQGLIALFPSKDAFVAKLTSFFEQSKAGFKFAIPNTWYYHGNEPDMLSSALFLAAGRADLADQWTRWVYDNSYTSAPDGLVGNDDAGTLSAWAVLVGLGLYPRPGASGWDVVAPRFDHAILHLGDKVVEITAVGSHPGLLDGGTASWNALPLATRWLPHELLTKGGALTFSKP